MDLFFYFYTRNKWKTVFAPRAGWVRTMLSLEPSYILYVTSSQNIMHVTECVTFSYSKCDKATRNLTAVPTHQSLKLLQLGATIKTAAALITILKRLPSDWTRHIQSCGQILFIKRAKTSAQLLLLKAPSMRVFCVCCAIQYRDKQWW